MPPRGPVGDLKISVGFSHWESLLGFLIRNPAEGLGFESQAGSEGVKRRLWLGSKEVT